MEYPESIVLVSMAESVWNGNRSPMKVDIAISDKLKAELKQLLNKNIQNIFLTDSDVRHIKKKHGQNEAKRGQIDIEPNDFALIPTVLNEFDKVEHTDTDAKGNKRLLFTKKVNELVYVAGIERGNSQIGLITLWKMPDRVPSADKTPPLANVQNDLDQQ